MNTKTGRSKFDKHYDSCRTEEGCLAVTKQACPKELTRSEWDLIQGIAYLRLSLNTFNGLAVHASDSFIRTRSMFLNVILQGGIEELEPGVWLAKAKPSRFKDSSEQEA